MKGYYYRNWNYERGGKYFEFWIKVVVEVDMMGQ
jgi:hypothetical protein